MLFLQLKSFAAVVKLGSFSKATGELFVSQNELVDRIRALEDELGVLLFERQARRMTLTPAGSVLYSKIPPAIEELERACREAVRASRKSGTGSLDIGFMKCGSGDEFEEAVKEFSASYPDVKINVVRGDAKSLYKALRLGRIDVIIRDKAKQRLDDCIEYPLFEKRCYVEASDNNPLLTGETADIKELKKLPCILVSSKGCEETERDHYNKEVGFDGLMLFAETIKQARIMVVANRGVMPVDDFGKACDPVPGIVRAALVKDGDFVARSYCAYRKKDNNSPHIKQFLDILCKKSIKE